MQIFKDRIPYSAIVDRPPLKLPDGKRMAVWFIANVEDLRGASRRARRAYIASLRQWNERYPSKMVVLYGVNRFIQAAANLGRPFAIAGADSPTGPIEECPPFRIRVCYPTRPRCRHG